MITSYFAVKVAKIHKSALRERKGYKTAVPFPAPLRAKGWRRNVIVITVMEMNLTCEPVLHVASSREDVERM